MSQYENRRLLIFDKSSKRRNCKNLISTINGLRENLSNCVKELNCVSSNLVNGLIIDGISRGSSVEGWESAKRTLIEDENNEANKNRNKNSCISLFNFEK